MDIDMKDTVVLSDDNTYVVVSKANYQETTYYYLIDKDSNENLKFCMQTNNNSLREIEDADLIQQLLPLFLEASTNAITKEDLELLAEESD